MPAIEKIIKKDIKSFNLKTLHDDNNNRKNKDFFPFTGTQVFCGRQGQGKTISMVKTALDIKKKYPKCKVVSNLKLEVPFEYYFFSDLDTLGNLLTGVNNDFYGVMYLIDEIHTYFNALDSKNIPSYIFTEISQQRKQRKLVMGTSQLYLRMAKPFREQCDTLIMCSCIGGIFNINRVYDGATLEEDFGKIKGELKRVGWFFQTRQLRNSYDTYQKVVSGREEYINNKQLIIERK